jgi:hypothetical protein
VLWELEPPAFAATPEDRKAGLAWPERQAEVAEELSRSGSERKRTAQNHDHMLRSLEL